MLVLGWHIWCWLGCCVVVLLYEFGIGIVVTSVAMGILICKQLFVWGCLALFVFGNVGYCYSVRCVVGLCFGLCSVMGLALCILWFVISYCVC